MQAEPAGGAEVAAKTHPPLPFLPLHFQAEDDVCSAALCRIVSRPRPSGDGALWEIWSVGASHAGGSFPRDIQLRLSQRGMTVVGSLSSACSSPDPGGASETTLNFLGATGVLSSQHETL